MQRRTERKEIERKIEQKRNQTKTGRDINMTKCII